MIEALLFEFMQHAVLAGLLVCIACGVIGTLVVVNRIVFISGGMPMRRMEASEWRCFSGSRICSEL